MGMSTGGGDKGSAKPSINVTPLIDVLLVLIIIFMVITPMKPSKFEAKVPAEPKQDRQDAVAKPNPLTLVVSIDRNTREVKLNNDIAGSVDDASQLTQRLEQIFAERTANRVFRPETSEVEKTVFIKSPKTVKYGDVAKVIDAVKIAKAEPVGLQIDDLTD